MTTKELEQKSIIFSEGLIPGLRLKSVPGFVGVFWPSESMYETLLVARYEAKQSGNYELADAMRTYAEFVHGRTINDTNEKNPPEQRQSLPLRVEPGHHFQQFRVMAVDEWLKQFRVNLEIKNFGGEGYEGISDRLIELFSSRRYAI